MLHVILFILKLIGMILLGILGLILLAVLMVLFVPVRYKGELHYHESLQAKGRVSWLLHIISMTIAYEDGELKKKIKIFGIPFHKREKKTRTRKAKERKKEPDVTDSHSQIQDEHIEQSVTEEISQSPEPERIEEPRQNPEPEKIEKKESLLDKWKRFLKMLYHIFHNIQYTIHSLYVKIKKAVKNIEYYVDLFEDEHTQAAMKLIFGELGKIMMHVKPRRFRMRLEIGTDDPGSTGMILAILGVIYPLFEGGLQVYPHFDEAVFETDVDLKGRITAFVFLRTAWKVYFNQDVKSLLKMFKNREEQ